MVVKIDYCQNPFRALITVIWYRCVNCFDGHRYSHLAWVRLVLSVILLVHFLVYWTLVDCQVNLFSWLTGCTHRVSSWCACWFLCRCDSHYFTPCTYCNSLSPPIGVSIGVLASIWISLLAVFLGVQQLIYLLMYLHLLLFSTGKCIQQGFMPALPGQWSFEVEAV